MQRVDFLVEKDNKDGRRDSQVLEKIETREQSINIELLESSLQDKKQVLSDRLEFFTGFAWCQALIFKSWVEASDKLIKLQADKGTNKEIPSLYVDVHEEVFTNLFKSQLYASNLGRMINASMMMIKNWQNLTQNSDSESNTKEMR